VDAVVTLGAVIQRETKHDEVLAHQAARKLLGLSVEFGKLVLLGIIGPGVTRTQAQEKIDEYAKRAVKTAVEAASELKRIYKLGKIERLEKV
jgi:6,7-dimethyl-8-ribityllumazine synthase